MGKTEESGLSTSKFENGLDIRSYLYEINFVTMTEFIHKVYSLIYCIINVLWMKLFKVWNWPNYLTHIKRIDYMNKFIKLWIVS